MRRLVLAALAAVPLLSADPAAAAGARLFKSGPVQVTADGRWVWVANADQDTVTRVDTSAMTAQELPLPGGMKHLPRGISVTEDGSQAWVACHDSDRVVVLDGRSGAVIDTVLLPWGSGPYSVALSRDQSRALVTLHRAAALVVVDVATRAITDRLDPVYWSPLGIAWMEDGSAWVTHLFADGEDPFLTRVDFSGAPRVTTKLIVKSTNPKQSTALAAPYDIAEGGYLTFRGHLAQVPSVSGRNRLFIPTQYNNINENRYTPDSTIQSTMRQVDLASHLIPNTNNDKVILSAVHVHDPQAGGNPYVGPGWDAHVSGPVDLGFSADGSMSWVLFEQSNDLLVMPTGTPATRPAAASPLIEIPVGLRPLGLAISPVGDTAFVWNSLDSDLSVVDLVANRETSRVSLTSRPAIADPRQLNGARLFHSSEDPLARGPGRISVNQKVACASCHPHGEHDGRIWDFQNLPGNHGPRSTMSLLGMSLSYQPSAGSRGQLHRSGDRDETQDFDYTFTGVSMQGTGFLGGGAQPEIGPPNAGVSPDLDDMDAYLLSLPPIARSPHRDASGGLSEAAVRGATFFVGQTPSRRSADASCAGCHVPETGFVDFLFHDVGQRRPASENELGAFNWTVNTPSLVGVWTSPPYDGVSTYASTMIGVLEDLRGRTSHGTPAGLTGRQLADLAELVLSIDGNTTAAEVRGARDVTPPRVARVSVTSPTRLEVWFTESVDPSAAAPAAWSLAHAGGNAVRIVSGTWDAQNGDRITLVTDPMVAPCAPLDFVLAPMGPIPDMADRASGGVANLLDVADPANTTGFSIGSTVTITLGASGYENVTVPVHDASVVGPNLSGWSHGSIWLGINGNGQAMTGFVRFDWAQAFAAATGLTASADIVDASLRLHPEWGDLQDVEARRVLKRWSDGGHGDWASNPLGAPTWSQARPGTPWGAANAQGTTAGVLGASPSDYDQGDDVSFAPDVVATMQAINVPFVISGPGVTDAFRFWFDNPAVDYGYALRVRSRGAWYHEAKFGNGQRELRREAPVLTITYRLNLGSPVVIPEVSGPASAAPLLVRRDPAGLLLSFEDVPPASAYSAYLGRIGPLSGSVGDFYSHSGATCAAVAAATARGRDLVVADPLLAAGERGKYILVTATDGCLEGPSGSDSFRLMHPPARLDCAP